MMYLRFVILQRHGASGVRDGLFRTAYALRRNGALPETDAAELSELLDWLDANLERPERFNSSTSKGHYRRASRGIAWLKSGASDQIARMRRLAALLARHGHHSDLLRTDRPGYIVYEDAVQIIAEPFSDTPT